MRPSSQAILRPLVFLLGGLLGWGFCAPTWAREGDELIGQPAPEWGPLTWLGAEPLQLEDLRGQVVLIRFWTDTCPFCAASAPLLADWHDRYRDRGLQVIGIFHPKPPRSRGARAAATAAERLGLAFPIGIDEDWSALERYWLHHEPRGWTSVSFLLDHRGRMRYIHPGGSYSREEAEEITAMIEELLVEAP